MCCKKFVANRLVAPESLHEEEIMFAAPATPNPRPFMTVEEAAAYLGISRGLAYSLANRYVDTGGKEGLPASRLGRRLLIKRAGIERLVSLDES
jgi:excisionase family DNA binding protein